jgi:hypothetical protein
MSQVKWETTKKYMVVSDDGRYYWEVHNSNGDVQTGWSVLREHATLYSDPLDTPPHMEFAGRTWEREAFAISPDCVDIRYYPDDLSDLESERFVDTLNVVEVEV